ncbi:MAG: NAD(P)-dependent oxidoreductase [Butyrivibrio sp.]|nr:NAD(P)-dependent oxidoreductase [Butyrivibrio sp.]
MSNIIITGVTSFLGSNLAGRLLADGNNVWGIVRPESKNIDSVKNIDGLNLIYLNFDKFEDGKSICDEILEHTQTKIDVWIHFSWDGSGSAGRSDVNIQKKNINNAMKAYLAADSLGSKRFIFSGSQAEYGDGTKEKPNPKSPYGKAKLEFGNWVNEQTSSMEFVHLRIYSIYGIGDHPGSLVNSCIKTFLRNEDMVMGPCTQEWNYMDIRDCTSAIAMLAERDSVTEGIFEIASENGKKLKAYVEDIWKICGESGKCMFGQRENNAEGAADLIADVTRLKDIGFKEKYTFEEGIKNLIDSGTL